MKLTTKDALKKGVNAHKSGNIKLADQYYTAILKAQPNHPDANHNMGVLAVGIGKVSEAIPFFKKALEENSSVVQFWISHIEALIILGRFNEARKAFDEVKKNKIKSFALNKLEQKIIENNNNNQITNIHKIEDPPQEIIVSIIKYFENKNYKKALILSNKILKDYPNSSKLFY